jgi:hypothetical protein
VAYAFNTTKFHNYGNGGQSDRVHLIFDARLPDGQQ